MTKKNELQARTDAAVNLILQGYQHTKIVQALVKAYNVNERTAKRYIRDAKQALRFEVEDLSDDFQFDLRRHEQIYRKAFDKDHYNTALRALASKNTVRKDYLNHQTRLRSQQPEVDLSFLEDLPDESE